MISSLHQQHLSLNHDALIHQLSDHPNLLIVQDLDGVCMGLVKDPLTRTIAREYLDAVQAFTDHFFVLTNGEHIGTRGVNRIIEQSLGASRQAREKGLYLPGLAAGGVQWQTRFGDVSHPGVSSDILNFLAGIPRKMEHRIRTFFAHQESILNAETLEICLRAAILDNKVSPTVNLNVFYDHLRDDPHLYQALQQDVSQLSEELMVQAEQSRLGDAFFVHYAPNLGQNSQGKELILKAQGQDSGTTDFQFMLRGARKEVGLLFLLNQYYGCHTHHFPLGESFNVLEAPQHYEDLVRLVQDQFDPAAMPLIVGVGDTVTSQGQEEEGVLQFFRGGSDRGFLQLVQEIGEVFGTGNLTVYVDSSGGEVKNRKPLQIGKIEAKAADNILEKVISGPTDDRDRTDPLRLNVAIPGGHRQYIQIFKQAAQNRKALQ